MKAALIQFCIVYVFISSTKAAVIVLEFFIVGIGGIFGSIVRYSLGKYISERSYADIPIGTLIINATGAILLGIVSMIYKEGKLYLLLAEGFLGAYTTFSTFMYEGFNLFQENEIKNAVFYIFGTLILGIIGFIIGIRIVEIASLL